MQKEDTITHTETHMKLDSFIFTFGFLEGLFSSLSFCFILIPKHMITDHIAFVFLAFEILGFIYLLLKSARSVALYHHHLGSAPLQLPIGEYILVFS